MPLGNPYLNNECVQCLLDTDCYRADRYCCINNECYD